MNNKWQKAKYGERLPLKLDGKRHRQKAVALSKIVGVNELTILRGAVQ